MGFRKPLIIRRTTTEIIMGRPSPASVAELRILASVQPITGAALSELQNRPEGKTIVAAYKIFSDSELFSADGGTNTDNDRALIDGRQFEIANKERWNCGVIPHFKYTAVQRIEA